MLNKILRITLAVIVLTCFVGQPVLHASGSGSTDHGPHDKLISAEGAELNASRTAQTQYDNLQTVNRLVGDLALAYGAKSEAIAKGKVVTIAAGVGAIGSAVLTGGATLPTVSGIVGAALSLGMSWEGSDNLLYRYNEALGTKVSQIETTQNAIKAYNKAFSNYLTERSKHLQAVTTHNQYHHKPARTSWSAGRQPDYSLPEFRCGGSCGQTFNTPLGDHGEICGANRRIRTTSGLSYIDDSVPPGCFEVWYSCVPADVTRHSPIDCTLDYRVYVQVQGENKRLHETKTCPEQFRRCVAFPLEYHDEIHHYYRDSQGRLHKRMTASVYNGNVTYDRMIKHQHKPKKETAQNPDPPSTPALASLSASGDIYTASAGDSHTVQLSILSKGASISFYVITPNDARNDVSTYLETSTGDGTTSAASVDYVFPSDVSGDYTFYATIYYNDGTSHSPHPSYTVTVSSSSSDSGTSSEDDTLCSWCSEYGIADGCGLCQPSTPEPAPTPEPESTPSPALHPCQVHPVTDEGDHSEITCGWCCMPYNPCLAYPGECSYNYYHSPNTY